jgi:hypothetical protein
MTHRFDPQAELMMRLSLHQPLRMWLNQVEQDKDIAAQFGALQALAHVRPLGSLPREAMSALNRTLGSGDIFFRGMKHASTVRCHFGSFWFVSFSRMKVVLCVCYYSSEISKICIG